MKWVTFLFQFKLVNLFIMKKTALALLLFVLAINSHAFCQSDNTVLNTVAGKLQSFYTGHIVEKAYLGFDKPYYVAGDTIYFKACVTSGEKHQLSQQSVVLYVDLINPQRIIKKSIKLELQNGLAWGDFALPDTLSKGNYRVRAYSKLMKNETGTCFFEQVIPIGSINEIANPIVLSAPKTQKPDLQFFPEGGTLLMGVETKVAFKAINPDGLGLNIKGAIVDNSGKTVANFASARLGMGVVSITPETGKTYSAHVTFADGSQNSIDLPKASENGIALALDNSDTSKLTLGIYSSPTFFEQNKGKVYNLIMNSGASFSRASFKLNNQLFAVDLKKSQFRTGIVQFTLFSPDGQPLSERLVFIQHNDLLNLKVSSDKAGYKTRGKVSINLNAKRLADSVATGHFSVSVTDENKVPFDDRSGNSILSWMLLTSDLRGYIEQPNYYFDMPGADAQISLDILMLTQGYRRFTWTDLLADKYPATTFQPEKALEIKGMISTTDGKPVANSKLNLVSMDGGTTLNGLTDSVGTFDFKNLGFTGNTYFMLKTVSAKNNNKTLITWLKDNPEPVTYDITAGLAQNVTDSLLASSQQNRKSQPDYMPKNRTGIKEAGATGNAAQPSPRDKLGRADQVVHREDIGSNGMLSDHLNGLLNGVIFTGDPFATNHKVPYLSAPQTLRGSPPMLVIVDGVQLPLGSGVDEVNINDVETVELFKNSSSSVLGSQGGTGFLYITTISRSSSPLTKQGRDGSLGITVPGYYNARTFYTPKYDHANDNANLKDLRSTIYWNPELVTDKAGNASFDFYNADGTGSYRIIVEGIDEKGNLGRTVYHYKVQ